MLGRLQGLQEEGQPAERGGPMPGYQSGTEQRKGAARSCHTTHARSGNFSDPDHEIDALILFGNQISAASLRGLAFFLQSPGNHDPLKDILYDTPDV